MINNQNQLMLVADLIAAQFGSSTEVVLHDFTGDLDHSIVYIVNGHVTGRTVGDAPTQSFLRYMNLNGPRKKMEKIRHVSHLPDGRIIRSSTVNFFDEDGTLNSSLCINQDITDLVALENAVKGLSDANYFESSALSSYNEFDAPPSSIHGMMDNIITEGQDEQGGQNQTAEIPRRTWRFSDSEIGPESLQSAGDFQVHPLQLPRGNSR